MSIWVGVGGMAVLLILLALGTPIAFAAAILGFVGLWVAGGWDIAAFYVGTVPYAEVAQYTFAVLPLYIIMGHFADTAGFAKDVFWTMRQWVGKIPGGLGIAATLGSAGFSAASGSSVASAAVLGKICIPEMERYGYDPKFACGTIASVANLDPLIPPSSLMVIYAIMTDTSIGKLFIAGVVPGLMLAAMFATQIYVRAKRNPKLAPPITDRITWKDRFVSLKGSWGILFTAVLVIGGIYSGMFTPTEAGAVGGFWVFAISLATRRLNKKNVKEALLDAGRTTCFVFFIVIGVMLFTRFLSYGGVAETLATTLQNPAIPPVVVITIMMLVYFILGCFFDAVSMMVLTLPIFFPTVMALGYDPVWFGVLVTFMASIGLVTPPVGINCYVIHGVVPHVPLEDIFKGIIPFLIPAIILLVLMVAFPDIVLFLPNLMD